MSDTYRTESELITIFSPTPPTTLSSQNCRDLILSSSFWAAINISTAVPGINDDDAHNFRVGNGWLRTSTRAIYVCTSASTGAATWVLAGGITSVESDTSPKLGGNLDAQTHNITTAGDIDCDQITATTYVGLPGILLASPGVVQAVAAPSDPGSFVDLAAAYAAWSALVTQLSGGGGAGIFQ